MFIFHLISLLSLSLSLVFGQDICVDQILDAAVFKEDHSRCFVFRGEYFWTAHSVNGIIDPKGKRIKEWWIDLPFPVDAAFLVDESMHRKTTVFIVGKNWYLYKDYDQIKKGTTLGSWMYFPDASVGSAFPILTKNKTLQYPVYFLYNNNSQYVRYVFGKVNDPIYNGSGYTYTTHKEFAFLNAEPGTLKVQPTLSSVIPATAIMANENNIWFFGIREYCMTEVPPNRVTCTPVPLSKWLGCQKYVRPTHTNTESGGLAESQSKDPNNNSEVFWILLFFAVFGITAIVICMIGAVFVRNRRSSPNRSRKSRKTKKTKIVDEEVGVSPVSTQSQSKGQRSAEVITDSKETIESRFQSPENDKRNGEKSSEAINKEQVVEADQLMAKIRSENNDISML